MADEILSGNPIITTADGSAWITKDKVITINEMIWSNISGSGELTLTNGGATSSISNVYFNRKITTALTTVDSIRVFAEPKTFSRLKIQKKNVGVLEIFKE